MKIEELWETLHASPEFSGQEVKTKEILKKYLEKETDCKVVDRGDYMYAVHDEHAGHTVAVRADIDAIHNPEGCAFHGCGHDGHMAMACGCAHNISHKRVGKNVVFLFQPAEETGAGALQCMPFFDEVKPEMILGLHNIPAFPMGQVLLSKDTFCDASLGLTIAMQGQQSHAACPEQGINPGFALADLIGHMEEITNKIRNSGPALSTLIYARVGEKNFGINAGEGEACFTLRARKTEVLDQLTDAFKKEAEKDAEKYGHGAIRCCFKEQDKFPAVVNEAEDAEMVYAAFRKAGMDTAYLEAPMRWSEDFGNYRSVCHSFFFGLGSGINQPGIHTPDYVFPEELLAAGAEVWEKMISLF